MSQFLIDRPIFAWVVALIVVLVGAISITRLPVARYPVIAPPSIDTSYVKGVVRVENRTGTERRPRSAGRMPPEILVAMF